MTRCLWFIVLLSISPLAVANGIDLNVNNKAARITADFDLSNNLLVDASWFHHQDKGNVFGAGLHVTGAATGGREPLQAGLGGRLLAIDADIGNRDSGAALPIGGFVNYTFPEYNRFSIGGSAYYAPDVLSFGDATTYSELNAWAGYSLLRNGEVYVGVRSIKAEFEVGPRLTLDSGLHVGLRLRF